MMLPRLTCACSSLRPRRNVRRVGPRRKSTSRSDHMASHFTRRRHLRSDGRRDTSRKPLSLWWAGQPKLADHHLSSRSRAQASAAVGSQQPSACKASDAVVANEQARCGSLRAWDRGHRQSLTCQDLAPLGVGTGPLGHWDASGIAATAGMTSVIAQCRVLATAALGRPTWPVQVEQAYEAISCMDIAGMDS